MKNNHTDYLVEVLLFQERSSVQIQRAATEISSKLLEGALPAIQVSTSSFRGDQKTLEECLIKLSRERDLIITIGGTGIGPEDFVPEATLKVCSRLLPGIPEAMRFHSAKHTSKAWLSRYQCGYIAHCLLLNLPGRPEPALQCFHIAEELIFHLLKKSSKFR